MCAAGSIVRSCTNGTWSPLDYSDCSFNAEQTNNSAFMLLWIPLTVDEPQLVASLPQVKTEVSKNFFVVVVLCFYLKL